MQAFQAAPRWLVLAILNLLRLALEMVLVLAAALALILVLASVSELIWAEASKDGPDVSLSADLVGLGACALDGCRCSSCLTWTMALCSLLLL